QLHIRLLKELTDAPEDVKEVWTYLEDDLAEEAQSFGGREVLNRLETSLSHVFQLGQKELEALTMKAADRADQLFASRIALASDEGSGSTRYEPSFSPQELISAQRAVPIASAIGIQLMA